MFGEIGLLLLKSCGFVFQDEEERASPTQSVGTNSSLLTLSEEEKALIYERLNYAQNILRFLNSCQGEGLEEVGQKQVSPYAKGDYYIINYSVERTTFIGVHTSVMLLCDS